MKNNIATGVCVISIIGALSLGCAQQRASSMSSYFDSATWFPNDNEAVDYYEYWRYQTTTKAQELANSLVTNSLGADFRKGIRVVCIHPDGPTSWYLLLTSDSTGWFIDVDENKGISMREVGVGSLPLIANQIIGSELPKLPQSGLQEISDATIYFVTIWNSPAVQRSVVLHQSVVGTYGYSRMRFPNPAIEQMLDSYSELINRMSEYR